MKMIVTTDLKSFGPREITLAGALLTAFKTDDKDNTKLLGDGVEVCFNTQSGCVFLSDEDYNTAMMLGDTLEDFLSCPECGHEESKPEFLSNEAADCCKSYYSDLFGEEL